MNTEEAREIFKQVLLHVDFVNLGRTISSLGEYGYNWITVDRSKWTPNKNQALYDANWLADHAGELVDALKHMHKDRS